MKKTLWTILCIVFVAGALCACSSKAFPTGKYTYGTASVEYRDDGTYTLMQGNSIITEGTYSTQDDEIQFIDSYCAEQNANPGIYKWQFEDGQLRFELIEDPCEGRVEAVSIDWIGPN